MDYHTIRNYLYVMRTFPSDQAARHVPEYAKRIVAMYDKVRRESLRKVTRGVLGGRSGTSSALDELCERRWREKTVCDPWNLMTSSSDKFRPFLPLTVAGWVYHQTYRAPR